MMNNRYVNNGHAKQRAILKRADKQVVHITCSCLGSLVFVSEISDEKRLRASGMISKSFFVSILKRCKIVLIVSFLWFLATMVFVVLNREKAVDHETAVEYFEKQVIAVQTGFYYNSSVFYPDNTIVLLFFGDIKLNSTGFACVTGNETISTNTTARIRSVAAKTAICRWTTYILTCPSVMNPSNFHLTIHNLPSNITIPLELPSRKPRGIVACYAPMFYEQRWQVVTMIHELNAGFGVDFQVHYVQSVVGEVMELLDPMVKQGLLELRGLDIPDYGIELTRKLGYNPAQATEARHQVMALQDCYFRYRESAEFIMISDPDDLFLPHKGDNLYDEFSYWKNMAPTASAWTFSRNFSYIATTSRLETFSVADTLNSIYLTERSEVGKSVYNPKYAETPWIHWPGLNNTPTFVVPYGESYGVHLKYNYDEPPMKTNYTKNIAKVVDVTRFENHTFIDYNIAKATITDLADPSLEYAEWITVCRNRIHRLYQIPVLMTYPKMCTTVTSCSLPDRNVNCTVAVRSYKTKCTQDQRICAMLPDTVLSNFVKRSNGCAWGITMPSVAKN
uniref:Glycosyltransferase family 92 protein n=1 Tax=Panagrellus redivivus TaxID=6233 RepID=A0A7E4UMX5_PANRE